MKTPFDDAVFRRMAWVHGVTEKSLGDIGTGIAWRMTPVFSVRETRHLDGIPRDALPFQFVWYEGDAEPTLEMEIKTGGRGACAIEYIHAGHGSSILMLRDRYLPETVRSALAGRPLSELVRHHCIPECRIVGVEAVHEDKDLKIGLDHEHP